MKWRADGARGARQGLIGCPADGLGYANSKKSNTVNYFGEWQECTLGLRKAMAVEFDLFYNVERRDPKQGKQHWWINATEFISYNDNHLVCISLIGPSAPFPPFPASPSFPPFVPLPRIRLLRPFAPPSVSLPPHPSAPTHSPLPHNGMAHYPFLKGVERPN